MPVIIGATRPALEVLGFFFLPPGLSSGRVKQKIGQCHPINKILDRAIPHVGAYGNK